MLEAKFGEPPQSEVRRIPLPRTPVNKGRKEGRAKRGMLGTTRRLKALGIFASILPL